MNDQIKLEERYRIDVLADGGRRLSELSAVGALLAVGAPGCEIR